MHQNQRHSLSEYAGDHHQLRRDAQQQVSHAGEENAQAVQNLRSDIDKGFRRTENTLVDQDGRIRPREVLSAVEDMNRPWWPTSTTRNQNPYSSGCVHGGSDSQPVDPYSSRIGGRVDVQPGGMGEESTPTIMPPPPPIAHKPAQSFGDTQMSILEVLEANNPTAKAPSYTNFKVSPAPAFNCERYGAWRKELVFWRELYFYVPDLHLLSIIGLNAEPTIKQLLIKFHHQTHESIPHRTLPNFLKMLDWNFLLPSHERELKHLGRLMELRKNASESVVSFWLRFEQLVLVLGGSSSQLSPSFLFTRAPKSLDFSAVQRSSILTFLECQSLEHTWPNLKKSTPKLLSMYSTANSAGGNSHSVLHSQDGGGVGGSLLGEEDQVFVIRKRAKVVATDPIWSKWLSAVRRMQ